jgi:glycosyltransferase involved in cell wall biosynthesis
MLDWFNYMKINKIYYLGHLSTDFSNKQNRPQNLAATQKINYILDKFNSLNLKVNVISPSWTNNKFGFYSGSYIEFKNRIIKYFFTFGDLGIFKYFKIFFSHINLFFYLILNLKKNDLLFVYHSFDYLFLIFFIKIFKRTKIVYQLEEIYSDLPRYKALRFFELLLIRYYDKYIISTELLKNMINKKSKYIILYGDYTQRYTPPKTFLNDDLIEVIYSGTLDKEKGGAYLAIELSDYLPKNYKITIQGNGSKRQIDEIKLLIKQKNLKNKSKLFFAETIFGSQYYDFLSKFQIGLACQKSKRSFASTSFPSKILVYLSVGLKVVSTPEKVLLNSKISNFITISKSESPKEIANSILLTKKSELLNSPLKELDSSFIINLSNLIYNN